MKKLRFDWLMLILSVVFSAIPAIVLGNMVDSVVMEDAVSRCILGALFFSLPLVFSLLAITAVEQYRKKDYILQTKGKRTVSLVLALVLGAILGGGGQLLYMIGIEEEEIIKDTSDSIDISIMIDYSKGIENYTDDCEEAVCDFIDGSDDDTNIQLISFASTVFEYSDLIQADDGNKEKMKDAVKSFDHTGGTDFDIPLTLAYETLTTSGKSDKQAVLIVSDGDCKVDKDIQEQFTDEDIPVYFINVHKGSSQIDSFVKSSKGRIFDMNDKSFDASELPEEMKNEYDDSQKLRKSLAIIDGVIYDSDDSVSFYKFLIRLLVFILYTVLAGYVMYYSISPASIISAVITGLIVALLTLTGVDFIANAAYIFAFWAAFTKYYPLNGGGYVV